MPDATKLDALSLPWRVEECADAYLKHCPCLVVAGTGHDQHRIVADTRSPEMAARIVADHNTVLLAAKSSPGMALAAQLTERLAALQDGNEGAYRELYDAMNGPHFCADRPFGAAAAEQGVRA